MTIGDILILRQGKDHFNCNRLHLNKITTGKLGDFCLPSLNSAFLQTLARPLQGRLPAWRDDYRPGALATPKMVVKLKTDK